MFSSSLYLCEVKQLFIIVLFFLNALQAFTQQPSHYIFGESEFKGVDIYDIIQDHSNNYWFATDKGLIKHDGYSYLKVECPEMRGFSVFGFEIDAFGDIYCFNLQRQVFRIRDGKMELYYEIPDEMYFHEIILGVDNSNNLIIQTDGIIILSPDKAKVTMLEDGISDSGGIPISFNILPDGSSVTASSSGNLIIQKHGKIDIFNYKNSFPSLGQSSFTFRWVDFKNLPYVLNAHSMELYQYHPESSEFTFVKQLTKTLLGQVFRFYSAGDKLWLAGNEGGIYVYDSDFNPLFNEKPAFSNFFISDVFEDREGNVLLSSFDEGLLVIPNFSLQGISLPMNERITQISSAGNDGIFLATSTGEIYHYSYGGIATRLFRDDKRKPIETMAFNPVNRMLVYSVHGGVNISHWDGKKLTHRKVFAGALKDVAFIDSKTILLAMNNRIERLSLAANNYNLHALDKLDSRAFCVGYNPLKKTVYGGLSNGLQLLFSNGKVEKVKFNGEIVFANSIQFYKGEMYVGTRKHGVLIYSNDHLKRTIPCDGHVRQLEIHNDQLFLLTSSGFYVGDINDGRLVKFNKSSGVVSDVISEFHVANGELYLTNSEFVEHISLEDIFTPSKKIAIHFKEISVNDKATSANFFEHDQSKLRFEFGVSTLRHRENIQYRYKLKGYKNEWQYLSYDENHVVFNALPPGNYTFVVQSKNGEVFGNPIEYSFEINSPYFQKWWFYLLLLISSGIVVYVLAYYRIMQIRQKNVERLSNQRIQTDLFESELKALRSQMNPHFIFNSLNSIQDLVLKEDTEASYDYIVLFADLVRSALNYSNKDFIPIEKEIEFLEVYLSLEKLRFKEEFEYSVDLGPVKDISVPSLLIQPFIENALLHGLIHKTGVKRLDIKFDMTENLVCTIRDNGIGRRKAQEIQERQKGFHESFALEAITKRLDLLNLQSGVNSGSFIINDLYENDQPVGTEVVLTMPYKRLY